jgi:hypothetical protein
MKRLIFAGILAIFCASYAHADRSGTMTDFVGVTTMTIVGVSGSSWTLVSSAAVTTYQMPGPANPVAYMLDHAPQNQSDMLVAFTTSTLAPATTFYGYTYRASDVPWILSLDRSIYVWAISNASVVQQLLFQQLK